MLLCSSFRKIICECDHFPGFVLQHPSPNFNSLLLCHQTYIYLTDFNMQLWDKTADELLAFDSKSDLNVSMVDPPSDNELDFGCLFGENNPIEDQTSELLHLSSIHEQRVSEVSGIVLENPTFQQNLTRRPETESRSSSARGDQDFMKVSAENFTHLHNKSKVRVEKNTSHSNAEAPGEVDDACSGSKEQLGNEKSIPEKSTAKSALKLENCTNNPYHQAAASTLTPIPTAAVTNKLRTASQNLQLNPARYVDPSFLLSHQHQAPSHSLDGHPSVGPTESYFYEQGLKEHSKANSNIALDHVRFEQPRVVAAGTNQPQVEQLQTKYENFESLLQEVQNDIERIERENHMVRVMPAQIRQQFRQPTYSANHGYGQQTYPGYQEYGLMHPITPGHRHQGYANNQGYIETIHPGSLEYGQQLYSTNQGYVQRMHPPIPEFVQPMYPENEGYVQPIESVLQGYGQNLYAENFEYAQPIVPVSSGYEEHMEAQNQGPGQNFYSENTNHLPMEWGRQTYPVDIEGLVREPDPANHVKTEDDIGSSARRAAYKRTLKARQCKNKRAANIASFHPSEHYEALPVVPRSWGTTNPSTGRPVFEYNEEGELKPHLKFTQEQLTEFLEKNPSHDPPNTLTLWIQICPADSAVRYSNTQATRCRFKDCPVPNNTIRTGHYRVAFDEHASSGLNYDPYHNAGYVHLYCFEKFFDFPYICKMFNVKPDTRQFADERNKMAITRDYPEMERVVADFITDSKPWCNQRPSDYHKQTLCYALHVETIKKEPHTRQATREVRDAQSKSAGNSFDKTMGNLEIWLENERLRRCKKPLKIFERPAIQKPNAGPSKKRKSRHSDNPEASSHGALAKKRKVARVDVEKEGPSPTLPPRRGRPPKRFLAVSQPCSPVEKPQRRRIEKRKQVIELDESGSEETEEDSSSFKVPTDKSMELKSEAEDESSWPTRKLRTQKAPKRGSSGYEHDTFEELSVSSAKSSAYEADGSSGSGSSDFSISPKRSLKREATKLQARKRGGVFKKTNGCVLDEVCPL